MLAVDAQREQRVRVHDLPGRQHGVPEGAALLQRVHQHAARVADPGQPGEIAQPYSGPGLVTGGPALDAGDRQVRRVLLHGEQVGPAQPDGRGTG